MVSFYLWINAALYAIFSVMCFARVEAASGALGYVTLNAAGHSEYSVVYGGLQLGLAGFLPTQPTLKTTQPEQLYAGHGYLRADCYFSLDDRPLLWRTSACDDWDGRTGDSACVGRCRPVVCKGTITAKRYPRVVARFSAVRETTWPSKGSARAVR